MLVNDRIMVDFIDKLAGVARIVSGKDVASIPASMLPPDIKEGDIIEIIANNQETNKVRDNIRELEDKLFR